MSKIIESTTKINGRSFNIMTEYYNNSAEMVKDLRTRRITSSSFRDASKGSFGEGEGCTSYDECLGWLRNGYQPIVDELKKTITPSIKGARKRISFCNNIVGGNPVVPLAMMGIPNCMIDTRIKPIKAKVLDVYYDITCSCDVKSKDIIEAGQKVLGTILRLEQSGYKFNLYAVQTYSGKDDCDMLAIKIKSSNQPLDLKRMSYTLAHTSFFRVLGFDWYSKTPKGRYRFAYGHNISREFNYDPDKLNDFAKQLFGSNAIFLSATIMNESYKKDKDGYINRMINADKKQK